MVQKQNKTKRNKNSRNARAGVPKRLPTVGFLPGYVGTAVPGYPVFDSRVFVYPSTRYPGYRPQNKPDLQRGSQFPESVKVRKKAHQKFRDADSVKC
eukprot:2182964-Rhodomonas_salina.1